MEFLARIFVTLRPTVNDPQGLTIRNALHSLSYSGVESVRAGKYMEVRLMADNPETALTEVQEMCQKLLANPVIEEYRYEIEESAAAAAG